MELQRRELFKSAVGLAAGICLASEVRGQSEPEKPTDYLYQGRTAGYKDYQLIEPGRKIKSIETFIKNPHVIVRVATDDGKQGYGQIATYDGNISALVLHQKVAQHFLGKDPSKIDELVDNAVEANLKFPWSFICRAVGGVDTAIWDLYGNIQGKSVCELLGAKPRPIPAYGSSQRRDISPKDEAARLIKLRDEYGFKAFKIRLGLNGGRNRDASPGRTEAIIPTIRKALGDKIELKADANSCYTPDKAIHYGRMLEDNGYCHYEEPCPYWELEWTAEVTKALTKINVAGGEQDNDLAQFRRMIKMNAVDIVQPDICYVGGMTRALRVAKMAELAGKPVVPHAANLSLVTLFTLHYLTALGKAGGRLEYTIEWETELNRMIFSPNLQIQDGCATAPKGPGWGITIDPKWLQSAEYQKSE